MLAAPATRGSVVNTPIVLTTRTSITHAPSILFRLLLIASCIVQNPFPGYYSLPYRQPDERYGAVQQCHWIPGPALPQAALDSISLSVVPPFITKTWEALASPLQAG